VQQRAQNAPHMRVIVDDKKSEPVEINTDHPSKLSKRR
jgi:hypothetical protein